MDTCRGHIRIERRLCIHTHNARHVIYERSPPLLSHLTCFCFAFFFKVLFCQFAFSLFSLFFCLFIFGKTKNELSGGEGSSADSLPTSSLARQFGAQSLRTEEEGEYIIITIFDFIVSILMIFISSALQVISRGQYRPLEAINKSNRERRRFWPVGYEGGRTPFYMKIPIENYYRNFE